MDRNNFCFNCVFEVYGGKSIRLKLKKIIIYIFKLKINDNNKILILIF